MVPGILCQDFSGMIHVKECVVKTFLICSYYGEGRDGASPTRDYPKPWLDFLYTDQRCEINLILLTKH